MIKRYSIADARAKLPSLIDEVEAGDEIELTRRGKLVAVLISRRRYARLQPNQSTFSRRYRSFVERCPLEEIGVDEGFFDSARRSISGRTVDI